MMYKVFALSAIVATASAAEDQIILPVHRYMHKPSIIGGREWETFTVCGLEAETEMELEEFCKPSEFTNHTTIVSEYEDQFGVGTFSPKFNCSKEGEEPRLFRCRTSGSVWKLRGAKDVLLKKNHRKGVTCSRQHKLNHAAFVRMQQSFSSAPAGVSKHGASIAPKFIRMIFHDAIDNNNLVNKNNEDVVGFQGGVDMCLHLSGINTEETAANQQKDEVTGDPDHNKGLEKAFSVIGSMYNIYKYEISRPDLMVLLGLMGIKFYGGPTIPFAFGREENPDQCKTDERFLKFGPKRTWDVQDNIDFFTGIGFDSEEMVALMGAHTMGGIQPCTGNGNPGNAPFCPDTLKETAGQEECQKLDAQGRTVDCMPRGSFYDRTPSKFDNDYFHTIMLANTSHFYPTCSSLRPAAYSLPANACDGTARFCNATDHLTSTTIFAQEYDLQRKIAVFPSDYTLARGNWSLADIVKSYAADEKKFHAKFAEVFSKVSKMGYTEDRFHQCIPDRCEYNLLTKEFECEDSSFPSDSCDKDVVTPRGCRVSHAGLVNKLECNDGIEIQCDQQAFFQASIPEQVHHAGNGSSVITISFTCLLLALVSQLF